MVAILGFAATFLLSAAVANAQFNVPGGTCADTSCKALADKFGTDSTAATSACATDFNCLCSKDVASALADCYKCAVSTTGSGIDQPTSDQVLKAYADGCAAAGKPVDIKGAGSSGGGSSGGSNGGKTGGASSVQMSGFAAAVALGGLALL